MAVTMSCLWRLSMRHMVLLAFLSGAHASGNAAGTPPDEAALIEQGRQMYVNGLLPDGASLKAIRASDDVMQGSDAACIRCHRASGMGSVEGNLRVAPISSRFLFVQPGDMPLANADGIRGKSLSQAHEPYSDEALAQTLHSGVNINGRRLSVLMPHYELAAADLGALKAYLATLSRDYSPGVSRDLIRFAAVITPEVSEPRRAIFKQMLHSAVLVKNTSTSPRRRYMTSAASFVTQSERKWDVDVWELTGAPATWAAQLAALYQAKPVFALLSGLSDGGRQPVDAFCNSQHIPCWFPSGRAPVLEEQHFGLYFSNGVVLDGQVLAAHVQEQPDAFRGRLTQFFVPDSAGAAGATAFRQALAASGRQAIDVPLRSADDGQLSSALQQSGRADALVLWLGPEQLLPVMNAGGAPKATVCLMAPLWADADLALVPASWRAQVQLVYPYEFPQSRQANLAYLHSWLKLRDIPLVDEVLQSELFFSLNLMTDTLQDMIDNMFRDYLIERTEDNIGKRETSKAEQENHDRKALGRLARASVVTESANGTSVIQAVNPQAAQQRAFAVGESFGTTVYPKLTLAPGQHFASRGAYVVGLAAFMSGKAEASATWIVP